MTATRGRTPLALVAVLSLVLSLFAVARPVLADHGGTHINQSTPISWDDATYNDTSDPEGDCGPEDMAMIDEGEVLWHFILAPAGDDLPDGATLTVEFEIAGTVTDESEADGNGALGFYVVTGPDTLLDAYVDTDQGQLVLSHICDKVVREGKIVFEKEDQDGRPLDGASFEVRDASGTVVADLDDAGALVCVDGLPFGSYAVAETDPPFGYEKDETVHNATVDEIGQCGENETPQFTFTNVQLLGSVLVHKTDADTDALVAGAVFTIKLSGSTDEGAALTEVVDGIHCIDGLAFGDYVVTEAEEPAGYLPADPDFQNVTVDSESSCDEARVAGDPDLVFENEAEEAPTGSITVNKELEECVACEAFTPGYWFNRGGGGGVDWANDWLAANPQTIDGIGTFASVSDVQEYIAADIAGEDGEHGLSATGQLLRHYLALVLNVAHAEANACDLASLEYEGTPISEWLAMALDALESDASDAEKEEIKDALDAINNSDAGDGTLECPSETTGGSVAGFTFTLWTEVEGELVEIGEMTTDASGSVTFSGLDLGVEYTITETDPEGLECTIVSAWLGEEELEVVDGMITVTLNEEAPNVTITVVNECEQPGDEDEFGSVSIVKQTNEEEPAESFAFEASWDADGFTLMDGDLEPSGDLEAGMSVTVSETLTPEQVAAGWSLTDIDCGEADVTVEGTTVTITVVADTTITCTFTNELEAEQPEDEGELPNEGGGQPNQGGNQAETPRGGVLGGNPLPDTALPTGGSSFPAMALAILMLGTLTVAGRRVAVEARRRR